MHCLLGIYIWLFVHRPFEYYTALGDLQIERVYMLLMLVAWAVAPGKGLVLNRLQGALAAFMVAITVCWLASPWRDQCGDSVENLAKVMVFYILFVTSVRDERGLQRMLTAYLAATGLYMTHSILEFFNGRHEFRMGIVRMVGVDITFRDPNSFASTLLLALVLTLPFWLRAKTLSARLPLLAFCIPACACILLTGSRTGFVGLAVVGLFGVLVSGANKLVVLSLASAAAIGVLALPGPLQDRFLTLVDPSRGPANAQESAEGRLSGLADGLELFERSPLLGIGPSAFPLATGKGFNPHNLYGQVLSETGLVGTTAFLGILACFWRNWREARRLYRDHPDWPRDFAWHTCRATGLAVVLLLFLGLAGHNLYRYIWIWLAAFQTVALHCAREKARSAGRVVIRQPYRVPYLPGLRPVAAFPPPRPA
jgi:O-antigen ligase